MRVKAIVLLLAVLLAPAAGAQAKRSTFAARDTLDIRPDPDARAQRVLDHVAWEPGGFEVEAVTGGGAGDAVVWLPSPKPGGEPGQDRVPLEWFAARDEANQPIEAPALLLVHSLHPRMPFAHAIAGELSRRGTHVFVVHLPGYGLRSDRGARPTGITALLNMAQAVGDIRRAADAIRVLPNIADEPVALAGVSLGGFAASVAASLDDGFGRVMLLLSGADGYLVLSEGEHDAAAVRRSLERWGYAGQKLRDLLAAVEPAYVVHRLDPAKTWLFSARDDQVVPRASSDLLSRLAGLDASHHVIVAGDHYTAVLTLPAVIAQMDEILKDGNRRVTGAPPP